MLLSQMELSFSTASPINKEKFSRQNKQIFEHLESGKTINVLTAINMGIYHLHSRISDLRNKHGVILYDRMINSDGVACKEYSLLPFNN